MSPIISSLSPHQHSLQVAHILFLTYVCAFPSASPSLLPLPPDPAFPPDPPVLRFLFHLTLLSLLNVLSHLAHLIRFSHLTFLSYLIQLNCEILTLVPPRPNLVCCGRERCRHVGEVQSGCMPLTPALEWPVCPPWGASSGTIGRHEGGHPWEMLESFGEGGLQCPHSHSLCFPSLCRPSEDRAGADSGV